VISTTVALVTSAVRDDWVQDEIICPRIPDVLVNPISGESSVCSVPIGVQLTAPAIEGIANAHNAVTAAKSRTPFFDNFFISMLLVSRGKRRDEWFGPSAPAS
jgi:hypothetical protein